MFFYKINHLFLILLKNSNPKTITTKVNSEIIKIILEKMLKNPEMATEVILLRPRVIIPSLTPPFEDELGGGGARAYGLVFGEAERPGLLHQALNGIQLADHGGGIDGLIELERAAEIEPFDHRRKINALEVLVEDLADGGADEIAGDGIAAFEFALVFQFEFAGDGGEGGVDIGDARDGGIVLAPEGAALGVRDRVFEDGDGEALADAGALIDALVLAGEEGQLFDHAADVTGHADLDGRGAAEPGFLLG